MLIVFGGRPGTGKTTISRAVAVALRAIYLRIDAIEQAIRDSGVLKADVGPSGYAIASANISDGRGVVADCVNPVAASRDGWRAAAVRANCRLFEVEIICSDSGEHRRRIETRVSDIPGLGLPSWTEVWSGGYEAWDRPHIVIATVLCSKLTLK